MADESMKESYVCNLDAGSVNPDDIDGIREAIESVLLSGIAAMKGRGVTGAKLKLSFKSSSKG